MVAEVIRVAEEREEVEMIIKDELRANPGPPGKYYPFKPPIKVKKVVFEGVKSGRLTSRACLPSRWAARSTTSSRRRSPRCSHA